MVMSERRSRIIHNLEEREVRDKIRREGSQRKKQHFIQEPYGLPRELQEKDKFYTEEEENKIGKFSKSKYWIHKDKSWDIKPKGRVTRW